MLSRRGLLAAAACAVVVAAAACGAQRQASGPVDEPATASDAQEIASVREPTVRGSEPAKEPTRAPGLSPPRSSPVDSESGERGAESQAREEGPREADAQSPSLLRLTEPSCCPLPFWSPDATKVLFWNAPEGGTPGIYGVSAAGGSIQYVSDRPLSVHSRGGFTALAQGDELRLERTADGRVWRFDTGGEGLVISADGKRAAWALEMGRYVPGRQPPPLQHMVADLATGEDRPIEVPDDYALSDWTGDSRWLLYRRNRDSDETALIVFDPDSGATKPLFDGERLRNGRTSPGGRWHVVMRVYEEEPDSNGLYLIATDGSVEPLELQAFGSYQWRDENRLLIVPQEMGEPSMRLLQFDARTGEMAALTDPAKTPFVIAAGEWSVAPDGSKIAFRSAADDAIWVLTLPGVSTEP